MSTEQSGEPLGHGSTTRELVLGVLLTALLVSAFWGASLPSVASPSVIFLGVVVGALLGVLAPFAERRARAWRLTAGFPATVLVVAAAVVGGSVLFSTGLPALVEIGVFAFVWADVLTRVAATERDE